jgi:hypothetical protein
MIGKMLQTIRNKLDLPVLTVALVYLVIHLATSHRFGYYRDELYYLVCGAHLAYGYVDHPPLVPAVAAVLRTLGADSVLALRLLPALCGALLVWLTGAVAGLLGGGSTARLLAALTVCCAPLFLRSHSMLTPAAFEALLWTGCCYVILRWAHTPHGQVRLDGQVGQDVQVRQDVQVSHRHGILLGLLLGVGLLNKYSFVFLVISLALGCLLTAACRRAAADRSNATRMWRVLVPAMVIAGLLILPNLLWQIQHGWPTLKFLSNLHRDILSQVTIFEFTAGQVFLLNPATWPIWLAGLWWLLRRPESAPYRAFGWSYLLLFLFYTLTQGKIYYLLPAYPILGAAGAVAWDRQLASNGQRFVLAAVTVAMVVVGIVLAPLGLALLPMDRMDAYVEQVTGGRRNTTVMAGHFADMHGWPTLAAATSRAWQALPDAQREQCVILAGNYGEAAAIEVLGQLDTPPLVFSGHNSYYLWGPPDEDKKFCLAVGIPASDLAKIFSTVEEIATIQLPHAAYYETHITLLLGSDKKMSWQEAWPWYRSYR